MANVCWETEWHNTEKRIAIFFLCIAIHYFTYIFIEIHLISQYLFKSYVIESELYTCINDCKKNFYKGINVTDTHLLDLQLLQDKNWMKNKV